MTSSIETSSRLQMWYLKAFRGHREFYRVRRPLRVMLGVIVYETSWVLTTG